MITVWWSRFVKHVEHVKDVMAGILVKAFVGRKAFTDLDSSLRQSGASLQINANLVWFCNLTHNSFFMQLAFLWCSTAKLAEGLGGGDGDDVGQHQPLFQRSWIFLLAYFDIFAFCHVFEDVRMVKAMIESQGST